MPRTDSLEVANALHRAAIRLLRMVRAVDDQTGVSAPKLSALSVLTFGGPQNLKTLARAEQVTPATMSKLVSDLEAAGLVAKRIDRADKRGVRIEITLLEQGLKIAVVDRGRDFADHFEKAVPFHDGTDRTRHRGYGLQIIKTCMDEVHYSHETDRGNRLVLTKYRARV